MIDKMAPPFYCKLLEGKVSILFNSVWSVPSQPGALS